MEKRAKDEIRPRPECNGEFNGQLEKCMKCDGAVECYKRNNPS